MTIRHLRTGLYELQWFNAASELLKEGSIVVPEAAIVNVTFLDDDV